MEVKRIGVVGAGQMGSGIAQVAASAGYEVVLVDVAESFLERGLAAIRRSLGKFLEKGKITQEAHDEALGRIRTSLSLEDLKDADLIVEAIVEDEGEKRRLFERLGALAKPEAILASNTSSIPITALARYSGRPERFIGMHFFNPVPLMQLVEVIRGSSPPRQPGTWWWRWRGAWGRPPRGPGLPRLHLQPPPHAHDQRGHRGPPRGGGHQGGH